MRSERIWDRIVAGEVNHLHWNVVSEAVLLCQILECRRILSMEHKKYLVYTSFFRLWNSYWQVLVSFSLKGKDGVPQTDTTCGWISDTWITKFMNVVVVTLVERLTWEYVLNRKQISIRKTLTCSGASQMNGSRASIVTIHGEIVVPAAYNHNLKWERYYQSR